MRGRTLLGVVMTATLAQAGLAAPLADELNVAAGSRLWVEGGSTVRSWRCEAGALEGAAQTAQDGPIAMADLERAVTRAEIRVPVAQLDCRNGTMNGHMRNALKAAEAPTIRYRITGHTVVVQSETQAAVTLNGTLTIAGQDRPLTVEATATRAADGTLHVRGTKQLQMTQWGVRPPSLMMGTMRVRDQVTVGFDLVLRS